MFEQLRDVLLQMIDEGEYKPGDLLPSERGLAEQYSISRVTVRQALTALARDGIIHKRQGKGNFVSEKRIETKLDNLMGFAEEFSVRGVEFEVSVVKHGYELAPTDVIEAMRLQFDHTMFLLVRRIKVEGQALGVDYTYIPRSIAHQFDQIDFEKVLVYRLLENNGYRLVSAEQSITAEMPNQKELALLEMDAQKPMLVRCRTVFVEGGLPIAYSKTLYIGDRYRYTLTLSRYSADDLHISYT